MSKSRCQQSWFPLEGLKLGASPASGGCWHPECPWLGQHCSFTLTSACVFDFIFFPLLTSIQIFTLTESFKLSVSSD